MGEKRSPRALICGISGQDGSLLARMLLTKGYEVWGTSRDAQISPFTNLNVLGIKENVQLISMTLTDFRSVIQALVTVKPDEVYNLAGQSSVGLSFEQPVEALESIAVGTLNLLEAIRFSEFPTRLYNACSSECFGDTNGDPATELTPFRPRSPYAAAKASAFWEVANYREAYELFACSGLLFNHESPLRPERFVTQKIAAAVARISRGEQTYLHLGDMTIRRDWGWAPEYIDAMWRMLQQETPDDFVIATGDTYSLEDFVEHAFSIVNVDWREHVISDENLLRRTDIAESQADPSKALRILNWRANSRMPEVVHKMVLSQLERPARQNLQADGCTNRGEKGR